MKLKLIMTISAANHLRSAFSTKVTSINNYAHFQKISRNTLAQSRTFGSEYKYNREDDDRYCFRNLEPGVDLFTLTWDNASLKKKLKIILLEIYNYRNEHFSVPIPATLEEKHYKMLLNLPTEPIRKIYLMELHKFNERNQSRSDEREKSNVNIPNHIWYGTDHNSMVLKLSNKEEEEMLVPISCTTMAYNDDIVIDLSYEDNMELNEMSQCVHQLHQILQFNPMASSSFNIHLCNVKRNGKIFKLFKSMFDRSLDNLIINIHEESYLDIFSHDKLVYLSPHAQDEVLNYNSDHIYIIGGVFDKFPFNHPYSYNKAVSESITVRRFPLDEILNWKRGSKTLGMYMSFKILTDLSYYRNWDMAFKNLNLKYVEDHKSQSSVVKFRNIMTALKNIT